MDIPPYVHNTHPAVKSALLYIILPPSVALLVAQAHFSQGESHYLAVPVSLALTTNEPCLNAPRS